MGQNREKTDFLKKNLKNFGNRKVLWNGMERLALNALNLCKINAQFNAEYVRSTLKFNARYVRSTPKSNANLCKISVECVEFM